MTTLKEFQEKINKIQDKVDLKEDSHQKNKTLLQIIKDICNDTLKEPDLKQEVKNEANKVLKKVNNDISLMKGEIHEDNKTDSSKNTDNKYSIGGYAPAPVKKVLNSVHAGAFDPLSSPILRNLKKKRQTSPLKKQTEKKKPVKPQVEIKEETIEKPVIKKTVEKKTSKPKSKKVSTPKKTAKKVVKKTVKKTVKKVEKKTTSKKQTPPTPEKKKPSTQLTPAFLEIEQIQLKINLPFKNSIEMLGRQDFENENLSIQIPTEFFSPILMRDPDNKEATEHCIIEQVEPNKYFLKDRFNLKKTYFNGKFINSDGNQLKDGDNFIFPVMINEQLSSLTVVFHIEKEN